MNRKHFYTLFGFLWLMSISMLAKGQSITITGATMVCPATTAAYTISPYAGASYYVWTGVGGTISGSGTSGSAYWGGGGAASISVTAYDGSNTAIASGTLPVTIEPLPNPYLTSDFQTACQQIPAMDSGRKPIPFVDTECILVCAGKVVTYTANDSAGSHFGWAVTGDAGFTVSGNTCTVTWGDPGNGSITVYDTSAFGCVNTKTWCVNILADPIANFTTLPGGSPVILCLNGTLTLIDHSTGPVGSAIIAWNWIFGDGSTSNAPGGPGVSITHEYTHPGTYTVVLTVTDACGCTASYKLPVEVRDVPAPVIECPAVVCQNDTETYSADGCSGATYSWNVIGGHAESSPHSNPFVVLWNHVDTSGFGYVSVVVNGCDSICGDTTYVKVPVILQQGHISGPSAVCPGQQYIYTLPQWPSTQFNWYISGNATLAQTNQPNKIAVNVGNGPGTIILKANYLCTVRGCGGLASDTIQILQPVTLSVPDKVCDNTLDTFSLPGSLTGTWVLTYPDNTTATTTGNTAGFLFNQVGTYNLSVTGNFCAPGPYNITVDPPPPPPDSITGPAVLCKGIPAEYTAWNQQGGYTFGWAMENGTLSADYGVSTYATLNTASTGPFVIMVWREGIDAPHCHSDTISKVIDTPFVATSITGLDTVCPSSFEGYDANTGMETYQWFVFPSTAGSIASGDGSSSVNVLWNQAPGTQAYLVVIERKCNSTYTDTLPVYIRDIPTFKISEPDTVCQGAPFSVSLVPPATGGIVIWNYGDGTVTASNSHMYTNPIMNIVDYTISATIIDAYGCTDSVIVDTVIYVKPSPVANITPDGPYLVCYTDTGSINIPLTATIQNGYGLTDSIAWFEQTSGWLTGCSGPPFPFPCSTYDVTHTGSYYIIAYNSNGCSASSNIVNVIGVDCDTSSPCGIPPPVVAIDTLLNNCGRVHLHGSYSFGYATVWTWPIQAYDVTTTNNTLDCSISAAGDYSFTYSVYYTNGMGDTCKKTVDSSLLVPLVPGMLSGVVCNNTNDGYQVTLYDHSNYYPGYVPTGYRFYNGSSWLPPFGTPPSTSPSVTFDVAGGAIYNFEEIVYYPTNDSCFAYLSDTLPSLPIAAFTYNTDSICIQDAPVIFTNTSSPLPLSYYWDFGDVSFNTQADPNKVYGTPPGIGNYAVTLTVTDQYGCTNSVTHNVQVVPNNIGGFITASDTLSCNGQAITLTFNPFVDYPEYYNWYNDQALIVSNGTSPSINVYNPGAYWVNVTNHYGCYANTAEQVVGFITPPPAIINGNNKACVNEPYSLNGYAGSDPAITYQWYRDGSAFSTASFITDEQSSSGPYTYQLVISITVGATTCSDTSAVFTVTVYDNPPLPTLGYSILDCDPYEVQLTATNIVPGTFNWNNGETGSPVTTTNGGYYQVTFTDTNGCMSTAYDSVPQNPDVYLWYFPTGCFTYCNVFATVNPPYILPPLPIFAYWAWLKNGTVAEHGSGTVPLPFTISGAGVYRLVLKSGPCIDTSGKMDVSTKACSMCDSVTAKLAGFVQDTAGGGCMDTVSISFSNLYGADVPADISAVNGQVIPASFEIAPGSSVINFRYVANPGFISGNDTLIIIVHTPDGDCHIAIILTRIRPCPNSDAPKQQQDAGVTEVTGNMANMVIAPNPADNTTTVLYDFTGNATTRYIEVYDMTGKLMDKYRVTAPVGKWQIELDHYAPGLYMVLMRSDSDVLLESKLSVVK